MPPVLDTLFVSFLGSSSRLLGTPPHLPEQAPDVGDRECDAEQLPDELGDPRECPEVGGISLGFGASEQSLFELAELLPAQRWLAPATARRPQGFGSSLLPSLPPQGRGLRGHATFPSDAACGPTLLE